MKTPANRRNRTVSNSAASRGSKTTLPQPVSAADPTPAVPTPPVTVAPKPATEGKERVFLERNFAGASKVFIAGSFNGWQPNATPLTQVGGSRWSADLVLAPGTYEYRFVVDDRWTDDPINAQTAPNPFGTQNAVLVVTKTHVQN